MFQQKDEIIFKNDDYTRIFEINKYNAQYKNILLKDDLSKHFKDYFPNSDESPNLTFYETNNRKHFIALLTSFNISMINFFKVTGPSNTGKSLTLLYFSRCFSNIVYLNLKYFLHLKKERLYDKILDVLFYELQRIQLNNEEINILLKIFYNNNEFWEILYQIIEKLKHKVITFILDQFSSKTINSDYYGKIAKIINGTHIRFIICSSINDTNIKEEIIISLLKNKGNPRTFDKATESFYYYISDLIDLTNIIKANKPEDKFYELFNFCDKYVKLLGNKPTELSLQSVDNKISKKIDKIFKNSNIDYKYILINIQNFIDKDINYENSDYILRQTPMKYFKLILKENSFQIDYQFPYIKIMTEDCLSENDIDNYFINKDYMLPDKKETKGIFFERAVKYKLKKIDFFPEKIDIILKVKSILGFEEVEIAPISNENNDYINEEKNTNTTIKNTRKRKTKRASSKTLKKKRKRDIIVENKIKTNEERKLEEEEKKDQNEEIIEEEEEIIEEKNQIKDQKIKYNQRKLKTISEKVEKIDNIKDYNGILIEQKNSNGPILDLGFLFGKNEEKTFIGFQIKNFGKDTDLKEEDKNKYRKENMLSSLTDMTNKLKSNYNISIKEYHIIFIIYHNNQDISKYNSKLTKYCQVNDIRYIFYDPVLKIIFNEHENPLNKLYLDDKTNLNSNSQLNPFLIFKNMNLITYNESDIVQYVKGIYDLKLYLTNLLKKDESKIDSLFNTFITSIKSWNNNIQLVQFIGVFVIKFNELLVYPKDSYGMIFEEDKANLNLIFNFKNKISFNKINKARVKITSSKISETYKIFETKYVLIIKAVYNY